MPTMNSLNITSRTVRPTRLARLAAVAVLLGGAAVGALAQYKIVGPDGKVTYTDKPPTPQDIRPATGSPAPASNGGLPYETRTAMGKYPVTIYTTKDCSACDHARQALRQRGVPFTEYSVVTSDDFAAFRQRYSDTSMPTIVIGNQTMRGYSSGDVAGYLDAAGYPAQAHLIGYSWPPAVPLAPKSALAPAPEPGPAAASSPASLLPPPSKNSIQF